MKNNKSNILLLIILAALQFVHILDFMLVMPMSEKLMLTFDINGKAFSFLVAAYPLSAFFINVAGSTFMDRFDRKNILIFAFTGFLIGTALCGILPNTANVSHNYQFFLAARIFTGLTGGMLTALVFSIIADVIPFEKRGAAMGAVMSAFSIASVVGIPTSLYVMNHFGWQWPFIGIGILSLLLLVGIILIVPNITSHIGKQRKSVFSLLTQTFKNRQETRALFFIFLLIQGQFTIIPFIVPFMIRNVGFTDADVPLIYLFGGMATAIGSPTLGKLSDSFGKHKVFLVMAFISIIPLIWITNLSVSSVFIGVAANVLFFIAVSGRMVPANTLMTQVVPPERRGNFMSLTAATQNASLGLAPIIAGFIIKTPDNQPIVNYEYLGYYAVAASIVAIYLSFDFKTNK